MKILSVFDNGVSGFLAEIECHISRGLPNVVIVGFANKAVDEAKERIRSAFASSELVLPKKRVIINLAPADIPKDTTAFDLGIAIAILAESKLVPAANNKTVFLGELGLDGTLKPIRGIVGKLTVAKKKGIKTAFIPKANEHQVHMIPDIEIYAAENLSSIYKHLVKNVLLSPVKRRAIDNFSENYELDYKDVVGQAPAKRALQIAAAGGHNILMNGPPGTGKSMLAKALPSILPPMEDEEILEVTHVHSLANKDYDTLITTRPFRAPHHSASDTAIIGGGRNPRPGEISLAHRGVLFFDEFPEFKRNAIESLRQPLEDGVISVSRAKDTLDFPADFILVATANPCPCGYLGTHKECSCLPSQIIRYRRKLSGPIIDRIDLYIDVENIEHKRLLENEKSLNSQTIREKVMKAREKQYKRFGKQKINANINNKDIKSGIGLTDKAKDLLNAAAQKLELSPRSYMRTLKVARTIADLADEEEISDKHVAEAIQYRPKTLIET